MVLFESTVAKLSSLPLDGPRRTFAFESAARHGSFTLAGYELFLTQSAISRHVRNLEMSLGVKLFRRNGRRLTLTPEGRDYMDTMSDAFDRMAAAAQNARGDFA